MIFPNNFGRIRKSKIYSNLYGVREEGVNFNIQYKQALRSIPSLTQSIIDEWEAKGYKVTVFDDSILIEEKGIKFKSNG